VIGANPNRRCFKFPKTRFSMIIGNGAILEPERDALRSVNGPNCVVSLS